MEKTEPGLSCSSDIDVSREIQMSRCPGLALACSSVFFLCYLRGGFLVLFSIDICALSVTDYC